MSGYVIGGGWLWSDVDVDFLVVVMVELRWRRRGRWSSVERELLRREKEH